MENLQERWAAREALIDRLASNLRPVRRLWPVNARLALWLLLEAVFLALAATVGSRPDLPEKIHSLRYLLEVTAFVGIGTFAAVLALRAAIPGREATKREMELVAATAAVAILFVFSEPMALDVPLGGFIRAGLWCAFCVSSVAVVPWIALLWAVRRGAPTTVATAGGLVGLAAFFFSLAITRLGCPIDDRIHFFIWHVIPSLMGIVLSVLIGIAWLRRKNLPL